MYVTETPLIHGRCPSIETLDFDVIFNGWDSSKVKGCASVNFGSYNDSDTEKSFNMRFGRLNNHGPRMCVSGT